MLLFHCTTTKKKPWSSIDFLLIGSSWQVGVERGGGCGAWEGRRGTCKHRATASPAVTWRARRGRITFKGEKKNKKKTWNKFSTPNRIFFFLYFFFIIRLGRFFFNVYNVSVFCLELLHLKSDGLRAAQNYMS